MTLADDPPQVPSPSRLATPDSGNSRVCRREPPTTSWGSKWGDGANGNPETAGGRRGRWLEAWERPIVTTSPVDVVGQEKWVVLLCLGPVQVTAPLMLFAAGTRQSGSVPFFFLTVKSHEALGSRDDDGDGTT